MMKKLRYLVEYIFMATFGAIAKRLPRKAVLFLGKRAGDLIFYLIPIRKKLTLEQLGRAFPEKDKKEIHCIARGAYQNLAMNSFEHLCLPGLSKEQLLDIFQFNNEDVLRKSFERGKGVVYVGGHFGNWEYLGAAISSKGFPITYVVAEIGNPYIDKMVNDHRRNTGIKILPKGMSVRTMLQTLRGNGGMGMLMDQDAGRNGIFISFFDRLCSTPKGPALFALKTGATLVFTSAIREEDGSLRTVFEEIEIDYSRGSSEDHIHEVMTRCSTKLESHVRDYPDQWLWMHRRWKTTSKANSCL